MKHNLFSGKLLIKIVALSLVLLFVQGSAQSFRSENKAEGKSEAGIFMQGMLREVLHIAGARTISCMTPCLEFVNYQEKEHFWILRGQLDCMVPLYQYSMTERAQEGTCHCLTLQEDEQSIGTFSETDLDTRFLGKNLSGLDSEQQPEKDKDATSRQEGYEEKAVPENGMINDHTSENIQKQVETMAFVTPFIPHEKQSEIDLRAFENIDHLIQQFYTVDPNTMVGKELLDVDSFLQKDLSVDTYSEGPQILIYHTHSQEMYADSAADDPATGIMGAGERLADILQNQYGYSVMHWTAEFDKPTRDGAYSRALPKLEELLNENPSIQVVIDLHRDEMPENVKQVMDVDGRPTARFMFFNGLSRTRKTGDITYLKNSNLKDNLAFSFRMKLAAEEYYPGLTRKNYLREYRFNMHMMDKYLLVELGAQNNTLEEALNACDPLAHILSLVLAE